MTKDKSFTLSPIKQHFRLTAQSLCQPGATKVSGATKVAYKSSALVDPGVAPPGMTSAEPRGKRRVHPLGVRFSAVELEIVQRKAKAAGCTVNSYVRASTLGSDYQAPTHKELRLTLLATNRELTALGRNFNQIAKHLNSGVSPYALLAQPAFSSLQAALLQTLTRIKAALAKKGSPS